MFATRSRAGGANLPPPSPTEGQVYSVPRLSGGYDYFRGKPGSSVPINDDVDVPVVAHPNPIGVSSLTIGCSLPNGAVYIGRGDVARGCVTPMPGAGSTTELRTGLGFVDADSANTMAGITTLVVAGVAFLAIGYFVTRD